MRTIRVLSWLMALILLLGAAHAEAALPDGEYAPDGFAFSGGSGRVTISCPQLRIVGGETLATLAFSSPNYSKLVLDGAAYAPAREGDASVFEVPTSSSLTRSLIPSAAISSTEAVIISMEGSPVL